MSRVGKNIVASIATILCIIIALSATASFSGAQSSDTTPPVTNASAVGDQRGTTDGNGNLWYCTNVTVTLSATDTGSGVKSTVYQIDGASSWTTYSSGITLTNGRHVLAYYSTDNAGNKEQTKLSTYYVDTDKPVTNVTINGNFNKTTQYYNGSVTVHFSAYDNMSQRWYTQYKINSNPWVTWDNLSVNLTIFEGKNTLYYRSLDYAGNIEDAHNVSINVSNPIARISILPEASPGSVWRNSGVWITLNASGGDGGINRIIYNLDGAGWVTYNGAFNMTSEGAHSISYRAVDNMGNYGDINYGDTIPKWFGIDITFPVVVTTLSGSMSGGSYVSDVKASLGFNVQDSQIAKREYSFDNSSWQNYTSTVTIPRSGSSKRHIYFQITDQMGRKAWGDAGMTFQGGSYNQGAMSNTVYINGVVVTPTPAPGSGDNEPGESSVSLPTRAPIPTSQLMPSPTPAANTSSGSTSPLAIAVLVGVLAVIAVAAAAYLFVLRPK